MLYHVIDMEAYLILKLICLGNEYQNVLIFIALISTGDEG